MKSSASAVSGSRQPGVTAERQHADTAGGCAEVCRGRENIRQAPPPRRPGRESLATGGKTGGHRRRDSTTGHKCFQSALYQLNHLAGETIPASVCGHDLSSSAKTTGWRRAGDYSAQNSEPHKEEIVVPLTQTQFAGAVAERADITKTEAKRILDALEEVVLEEIANAEKVKIGGLVQLTVRVKPASKARKGRNPATGEEITIAAKPASVDLRARALTKAKAALPSVQKARRRLS